MAIVTPADRPKSVRNRCVIEVLVAFFVLSRCFLDFSVGVRASVIGLSQISSFSLTFAANVDMAIVVSFGTFVAGRTHAINTAAMTVVSIGTYGFCWKIQSYIIVCLFSEAELNI